MQLLKNNHLGYNHLLNEKQNSEQQEYIIEREIKEVIRSSLSSIRQATEERLGKPSVTINSISYPQHFRGVPYVTPIAHTAIETYPGIKDVMQVTPYLNSIRLAYGLDTSEALGYAPEADIKELNSILLHFDYQKEFLEVSLMGVTEYIHIREQLFRIDDFGGSETIASVRNHRRLCP